MQRAPLILRTCRYARLGCLAGYTVLIAVAGAACAPQVHLGELAVADGGDGGSDRGVDGGGTGILWAATFEPGDLSEWLADGHGGMYMDKVDLGPSATVDLRHRGQYAGVASVSPTPGVTSLSYLFREQPSPPVAYYSAWYYIPSWYLVRSWLSLSHFRCSRTGDGDNLFPIWDLNLYPRLDGSLVAHLYNYTTQLNTEQLSPIKVPTSTWIHFEIMLRKAPDATGQIAVYQDGVLILRNDGIITADTDWVQWDVGVSSDNVSPPTAVVYVDDAAISLSRLGTADWSPP